VKYKTCIISCRTLYQGFLGLREYRVRHSLFAGGDSEVLVRECVQSYAAASVMLYDPDLDKLVMIEQFRIGALERVDHPWVLEIVGGIIGAEETAEQVARREALEEAGCEISTLRPICDFMVSPGFSTEYIHLFCGRVDATAAGGLHGLKEEGEDTRVSVVSAADAITDFCGGRINSTSSIIATQWLALNRAQLRQEWCCGHPER